MITDNGRQYCSEEFKEFILEWSFVHKTLSSYYPKGNSYAERAVGVVKEIYTKCKDNFLLGLLVHRSTPLLYPNAKSSAELFLGHKIATNIPYIPFGTAALMHHSRNLDDHDNICRFEPNDGDSCYVRINSNENTWEKGANNNDDDKSDSDNHQADHNVPMARAVTPTLCPRPQLKFPMLPVQATQ